MTATTEASTSPRPGARRPAPLSGVYRFELLKLLSPWRVRLLLLAAWLGPAALVAVLGHQDTLPADTVFGRWMHTSGWAGSLVVLSFSGAWLLPLLTSLVAGDVFASEDRLGTWRHLLVAVRSARRIFLAKVLAGLSVVLVLVAGLGLSSVAGGLLSVAGRSLIGLDGQPLTPGAAAVRVLLAWLSVLTPTLALVAIGLLGSVMAGRSPIGLLLPVLVALALQVAQLLPLPVPVRLALPGYSFLAWRGLFTDPAQLAPLFIGQAVSLGWAVLATALAHRRFLRRDFTNPAHEGSGPRAVAGAVLALVAGPVLAAVVLAVAAPVSGSGIEPGKLDHSLARVFGHLYRRQAEELHRPAVTEEQLQVTAACLKGEGLVPDSGPGNGWRCTVTWHLPGITATGTAVYQLNVTADGRYAADGDGPNAVNGYFLVHTATGNVPNPLWQFDGLVDLLTAAPKG